MAYRKKYAIYAFFVMSDKVTQHSNTKVKRSTVMGSWVWKEIPPPLTMIVKVTVTVRVV